jgi:hypothetical protein
VRTGVSHRGVPEDSSLLGILCCVARWGERFPTFDRNTMLFPTFDTMLFPTFDRNTML